MINKLTIKEYSEDINSINPDIVISLNYSSTYSRHYNKFINIDFIHGKAQVEDYKFENYPFLNLPDINFAKEYYRDENHIVLGIDEYLSEEQLKRITNYIGFRKYFQRITKRTGTYYKNFLTEEKTKVYFFGHSLDPTDSELITELIDRSNTKTTIFYHDEKTHIKEITNLVRIFGKKEMINKCYGSNPDISFKFQKETFKLDGDEHFKIIKAMTYLSNIKKINGIEFDKYYNILITAVSSGRGIKNQKEVIRAYKLLHELGKGEEYKDNLLEICAQKPAVNDNGILVNACEYDPYEWSEVDEIRGNLYTPSYMSDFIQKINELNEEKLKSERKREIIEYSSYIHEFEEKIPLSISLDEYRSFLGRMIGLLKTSTDTKRIWNLLEKVTVASGNNNAKEVLEDQCNSKDEFSSALAFVLLDYLRDKQDRDEYLNYQMENTHAFFDDEE